MTANELADINEWSCCAYSKEVSAMLRQQQAEIEVLKEELALQKLSDIGQAIEQEPVAYINKDDGLVCAKCFNPLYTHPVRCNKCNDTGWVCECHPDKEAHKCCGGAGMPCECTKESE